MWKGGLRVTRKWITLIAKERKTTTSWLQYVSEQTHSTEHYGSPVRHDTSNSSSPQPTLERPVESKVQIGTLKELVYCMCVSTGRYREMFPFHYPLMSQTNIYPSQFYQWLVVVCNMKLVKNDMQYLILLYLLNFF